MEQRGVLMRGWEVRTRVREEHGNTSVLTIGLTVIVLMLIGFGVALTGVEIDRNRLQFVADGAALYASSAFDERQVYDGDGSVTSRSPTEAQARDRVREYLAEYPLRHRRLSHIQARRVSVEADGRVHVELVAQTKPPLVGWISESLDVPVRITVASEAHTH